MENKERLTLSVVIPVFNEEKTLPILLQRVRGALAAFKTSEGPSELVFVNDGSSDGSANFLRQIQREDSSVVVVNLSRNFGQMAAISAGLAVARGKAIVVMDADLQDPPEMISEMFREWRQGHQVVVAQRCSRQERGLRRFLINSFHAVFKFISDYPIPENTGVFSLIDRTVAEELTRLPEQHRFFPGLLTWIGFRKTTIFYDRDKRAAGVPKQSFSRLLNYGLDAVFSFSYKPLRLSFLLGCSISATFFFYAIALILLRILRINVVSGFTTPTVAIMILGGIQLIGIGILGECMGRIYDEVKRRPLYIISDVWKTPDPDR